MLNGGYATITAATINKVLMNSGHATIKKAKVGSVKINSGIVNLEDGAEATKYTGGGSCDGCPQKSNKW